METSHFTHGTKTTKWCRIKLNKLFTSKQPRKTTRMNTSAEETTQTVQHIPCSVNLLKPIILVGWKMTISLLYLTELVNVHIYCIYLLSQFSNGKSFLPFLVAWLLELSSLSWAVSISSAPESQVNMLLIFVFHSIKEKR